MSKIETPKTYKELIELDRVLLALSTFKQRMDAVCPHKYVVTKEDINIIYDELTHEVITLNTRDKIYVDPNQTDMSEEKL
tara:strand:+ start:437 stop:676 length:240 start_codon:yes stop_codon:yes gene_type:complete